MSKKYRVPTMETQDIQHVCAHEQNRTWNEFIFPLPQATALLIHDKPHKYRTCMYAFSVAVYSHLVRTSKHGFYLCQQAELLQYIYSK